MIRSAISTRVVVLLQLTDASEVTHGGGYGRNNDHDNSRNDSAVYHFGTIVRNPTTATHYADT